MNPLLPLSQSTGYAIQALSCLEEPGGQPYLVQVVAECTGISPSYLSKVMQRLAQKGLIVAKRGKNGGVVLARPAREITLYDLAEAVDGARGKTTASWASRTARTSAPANCMSCGRPPGTPCSPGCAP